MFLRYDGAKTKEEKIEILKEIRNSDPCKRRFRFDPI
jgi:hypothetical protein